MPALTAQARASRPAGKEQQAKRQTRTERVAITREIGIRGTTPAATHGGVGAVRGTGRPIPVPGTVLPEGVTATAVPLMVAPAVAIPETVHHRGNHLVEALQMPTRMALKGAAELPRAMPRTRESQLHRGKRSPTTPRRTHPKGARLKMAPKSKALRNLRLLVQWTAPEKPKKMPLSSVATMRLQHQKPKVLRPMPKPKVNQRPTLKAPPRKTKKR